MQFDWRKFIVAGKAIFTVENTITGKRFTYKVKKHDEKDLWFVSVLDGPDNYVNYAYIGIIQDGTFELTRRSRVKETAQSFRVFKWLHFYLIDADRELPTNILVHHAGKCGRCGRLLTVPQSIEWGFGPECILLVMGPMKNTHIDRTTAKNVQKLLRIALKVSTAKQQTFAFV